MPLGETSKRRMRQPPELARGEPRSVDTLLVPQSNISLRQQTIIAWVGGISSEALAMIAKTKRTRVATTLVLETRCLPNTLAQATRTPTGAPEARTSPQTTRRRTRRRRMTRTSRNRNTREPATLPGRVNHQLGRLKTLQVKTQSLLQACWLLHLQTCQLLPIMLLMPPRADSKVMDRFHTWSVTNAGK